MKDILISIGVAIYNVAPYLRECLDSVISQRGEDVEIILVDDGSTDSSAEICEEYAARDSRIRVIHQKNQGLSAARNASIVHARGRWLFYVDGDDMLTGDAVEQLRPYLEDPAQLVIFGAEQFGERSLPCPGWSGEYGSPEEIKRFRCFCLRTSAGGEVFYKINSWCKLWRLDHLREQGILFDPSCRKGQDLAFAFAATRGMSLIRAIPACVYRYRINAASISNRFSPRIAEYEDALMKSIWGDLLRHGEDQSGVYSAAYSSRAFREFTECLARGISHRDCPWSREEKLEWLRALCALGWVRQMAETADLTRQDWSVRRLLALVRAGNCEGILRLLPWVNWHYPQGLKKYLWIYLTRFVGMLPFGGSIRRLYRKYLKRRSS